MRPVIPQGVFVFQINELVVYPAQGVGRIERIESQLIGGVQAEYYIVRILSNSVTLIISLPSTSVLGTMLL